MDRISSRVLPKGLFSKSLSYFMASLIFLAPYLESALAVETRLVVHVKSKGAKFIGDSVGGASVKIYDYTTGQILSQGATQGETGETELIMGRRDSARDPITNEQTAKFATTLNIDKPTWVRIVARGPLSYPQSINEASVTQWLLPGKHLDRGDAILLDIPGLIVDLERVQFFGSEGGNPARLYLKAKVAMLCGCPIVPNGLWDANKMEIVARISWNNQEAKTYPLNYNPQNGLFELSLAPASFGTYQIEIHAYDPDSGNTGLDRLIYTITGR